MALVNAKQLDKGERRWLLGVITVVALVAVLKMLGVV